MKNISIIVCFLNAVVSYSQVPDIDINIYNAWITEKTVSFQYTIRNNSAIPVWFHAGGGRSINFMQGNTLFIAPVDHSPSVL